MAKFVVNPVGDIQGEIRVVGAKNAVLPLMAASLLAEEECVLEDVPYLDDVLVMTKIIESLGSKVNACSDVMHIYTKQILNEEAPYELVSKMRSSFDILGPLLARNGFAKVPLPGGCQIGDRPIDLHLKGLRALGAKIEIEHGFVRASAKKLYGSDIFLDFPSVGATKNILMAATRAIGVTTINNAAKEPEVVDLVNFLVKLGAKISGAGTDCIKITGVDSLGGAKHIVMPDRIVAGTYLILAAMHKSSVTIKNVEPNHLRAVIAKLQESGAVIVEKGDSIHVSSTGKLKAVDITTLPYPGFPTDLQALFMALLSVAKGSSSVIENLFENRFLHVPELIRMGAKIQFEGHSAVVTGGAVLQGTQVKATDLRAGGALILAALVAKGKTYIHEIHHIDRGYFRIEEALKALGINIERVED